MTRANALRGWFSEPMYVAQDYTGEDRAWIEPDASAASPPLGRALGHPPIPEHEMPEAGEGARRCFVADGELADLVRLNEPQPVRRATSVQQRAVKRASWRSRPVNENRP